MNTDYTLSITEGEERYIVISSDKYYSVNKFAYTLLHSLKEKRSILEIAEILGTLFPDMIINAAMIMKLLSSEEIRKILYPGKAGKEGPDNNYIWFKREILSPEKIAGLLTVLGDLFKGKIYSWLFVISSITTFITFCYFVFLKNEIASFDIEKLSTFDITLVLLASLCITFIHEIGHAAAARKKQVTSKTIGFGFYFVFPVFFTELTDIWRLPTLKRIQVNLAGIYFQLLINILLIAGYYASAKYPLWGVLFFINTISILGSLNPFFRYDGYWVFSDLIHVPNLREKSTSMAWNLSKFSYLRNLRSTLKNSSDKYLVTYCLLNMVFWLFVYSKLIEYIIITINQLAGVTGDIRNIGLSLIYNSIILFVIMIHFLYKLLKRIA